MNTKTVFQCDPDGWYLGEVEADEDPLEPGRYLIPAHAVETAPPARPWPDGKVPRWDGSDWIMLPPPVDPEPPPPVESPPTAEQIMARLEARVQQWLDEQARALGYDDIKSAVTYAEEPAVPKFQQEGRALRRLRSLAWARCYEILNAVQAGQRPIPTEADLIAEMEALR